MKGLKVVILSIFAFFGIQLTVVADSLTCGYQLEGLNAQEIHFTIGDNLTWKYTYPYAAGSGVAIEDDSVVMNVKKSDFYANGSYSCSNLSYVYLKISRTKTVKPGSSSYLQGGSSETGSTTSSALYVKEVSKTKGSGGDWYSAKLTKIDGSIVKPDNSNPDNSNKDKNTNVNNGAVNCDTLFGDPNSNKYPAYYISFIFKLMKYLAISILFVFTIINYVTAITSSNDDALKKANTNFIKRLVICIIIFFLPIIIDFLMRLLGLVNDPLCGTLLK